LPRLAYETSFFHTYHAFQSILWRLFCQVAVERLQQLEFFALDYKEFLQAQDLSRAVVYCDIPYKNTSGYGKTKLDYDEFYGFIKTLPCPVFVSSFDAPLDCAIAFKHKSTLGPNNKDTIECIFLQKNGNEPLRLFGEAG
jgi:hypothetical protein